jgi:hypothetical protein
MYDEEIDDMTKFAHLPREITVFTPEQNGQTPQDN